MLHGFTKKSQWTISHESGHSDYIFNVNSEGNINGSFSVISNVAEVRPVVYLNSSIMLSGTGTINDPYVIVRFL